MIALEGSIEKVFFHNESSGWTIAKFNTSNQPDPVNIVGSFCNPREGENFLIKGQWGKHPKYGEQFKVTDYEYQAPQTREAVIRYLGSGSFPGIREKMATRIVDHFGHEKAIEIIMASPDRLKEVKGFAKKKVSAAAEGVARDNERRPVIMFLNQHGITTSVANKIYEQYGDDTTQVVKDNPYLLYEDISGIGFKIADQIAKKMGFSNRHPKRIEAGVLFELSQLENKGHVFAYFGQLSQDAAETLMVEFQDITDAIFRLDEQKKIVVIKNDQVPHLDEVYPRRLFFAEVGIAKKLTSIMDTPAQNEYRNSGLGEMIEKVESRQKIKLAPQQYEAVQAAVENKGCVITGGPGTGKTTIIRCIAEICASQKREVVMCAPTGRAAKRMQEATGFDSCTIHRLLEYKFSEDTGFLGFQRNRDNPLSGDIFIIDETSMVDTKLMNALLEAVPAESALVMVGDIFQLPSVGAGNVLADIINSLAVPVVRLSHIFRQAKESQIITNAHLINNGEKPDMSGYSKDRDFWFFNEKEPEKIYDLLTRIVKKAFPDMNAKKDIQVLTPIHRGPLGTTALNELLQQVINPGPLDYENAKTGRKFKVGDKVMQMKNNYDDEVFNGDVGIIRSIRGKVSDVVMTIDFEGKMVTYEKDQVNQVNLAYCCTVHKSQGSEYPVVVMVMTHAHYIMLARNLLYTGVTRGKKQVILIGEAKAVMTAVKNNKVQERNTRLKERLEG